jgi:hypothetical protein
MLHPCDRDSNRSLPSGRDPASGVLLPTQSGVIFVLPVVAEIKKPPETTLFLNGYKISFFYGKPAGNGMDIAHIKSVR